MFMPLSTGVSRWSLLIQSSMVFGKTVGSPISSWASAFRREGTFSPCSAGRSEIKDLVGTYSYQTKRAEVCRPPPAAEKSNEGYFCPILLVFVAFVASSSSSCCRTVTFLLVFLFLFL